MTKPLFPYGCLATFVLLSLFTTCRSREQKASSEAALPEISVARPLVKAITLHKSYPGYLEAEKTVDLVARVAGYLQQVSYRPGSVVQEGDLLFTIEPTLYQDQLSQAEAAVRSAESKLSYMQNNYARMKEAAQSDAISEIDLIQAESNVQQAESALKEARAQLSTAQTNLDYCYIRAPFAGRVSRNLYDEGSYIDGSGQAETLATLYQEGRMYAYFDIEDNQYLKMIMASPETARQNRLPREVGLEFQQPLSRTYTGRLDYLSPNVELTTGTLSLRAEVDNPLRELKSGLYVTVNLPYGRNDSALLIDDAAIGSDQSGKYVYLVNDSDKVVYRHIETGELVDDTLRQVTGGLLPGDRYVTKALLKVRDGMQVKPLEENR
ncbi:MAG: efflux RND transporter periplasmic adaptor subunit [Coprobacter sp.]|nr:efflux RND transporter periplasmic adaptor subunit [Coprobacter sp.]